MPSPFPGMDPYIERPSIWPDFHDSLIAAIRGGLQQQLRPRYAALTQDRLYVMESERPIYPDIGVIRTGRSQSKDGAGAAVLEADTHVVFELPDDEIREPYIEIIEPAAGNRVVTAIEVLSPTNKTPGEGRASYEKKRKEFWEGGVHLVEIDLLREGVLSVHVSNPRRKRLGPFHYLAVVTRRSPRRQEVYPIPLQQRLPRISIPLSPEDKDVTLDLQAAFTRCWDEGPYPELLHYHEAPPGTLTQEEVAWCQSACKPKQQS